MKARNIIWIIIALILVLAGIPVVRFVYVNMKAGYDEAERQAATRPASHPDSAVSDPPAKSDKHSMEHSMDFSNIDFSQNTIDLHNPGGHYVDQGPPLHGSGHNGWHKGAVSSGKFEILGGVESIAGASANHLPSYANAGGIVTLELAVDEGTVRVYLIGLKGHTLTGYVYVEATPGHPGRVTGYLNDWSNSGTPEQDFVLEVVTAEARGVHYRVYRAE